MRLQAKAREPNFDQHHRDLTWLTASQCHLIFPLLPGGNVGPPPFHEVDTVSAWGLLCCDHGSGTCEHPSAPWANGDPPSSTSHHPVWPRVKSPVRHSRDDHHW